MRKIAMLVLVAAPLLAGCTLTAQQAKDIASASLDTICANLSTADMTFQGYVAQGKVSAQAQRAERDAVAAVQGICQSRPVKNTGAALAAASAAFSRIVAAETAAGR